MNRLSVEIRQTDPIKNPLNIHVSFAGHEGIEDDTRLPFDSKLELPAVLKVLELGSFSTESFRPEEIQWLLENRLMYEHENVYYFTRDRQERIGRLLYDALFKEGKLRERLKRELDEAIEADQTLFLEIKFAPRSRLIGAIPWELMHNGDDFLCRAGLCTLTRYIAFDIPKPKRSAVNGLKILLISPRPADLPGLSTEEEAIRQAFSQLRENGRIQVDELEPPTFSRLQEYLSDNSGERMPHILHFDGHGVFGRLCNHCKLVTLSPSLENCPTDGCGHPFFDMKPQGYLAFESDQGLVQYISARNFAAQLRRAVVSSGSGAVPQGLCLVTLSACKTAVALQGESVFNGVAQRLIDARIPAVVAMQFSINAQDAKRFVETFYRRIVQDDPLVDAVSWGWTNLDYESDQWYRPVLYMRWQDDEGGRLFELSPPGPVIVQDKPPVVEPEDEPPTDEGLDVPLEYYIKLTQQFVHGEGQKVITAVNQHGLVKDFVRMVVPRWRKDIYWHIIVIEAGKDAGKTLALNRFEYICKHVRNAQPLLYYRIDFQGLPLTPRKIATRLLDGLIDNADYAEDLQLLTERYLKPLYEDLEYPSRTSPRVNLNPLEDPDILSKQLYKNLAELSKRCTIVLLFDNCHVLFGPTEGSWLVCNFLTRVRDGPSNLITVLTSEMEFRGDQDMTNWSFTKIHRPISPFRVEDVQELAKLQYNFSDLSNERASFLLEKAKDFESGNLNLRLLHLLLQVEISK